MVFRPTPDAVIGGKYRLLRRLAGGGMGAVWLAKHETLDAEVAVKLMSPQLTDTPTAMSRFEREAKASAQLKSPHIVKVQDYGIEDETPFMVMEALDGEDLGERLNRVGRMPIADVAVLTTQIAKALRVAHEAGIVHRDLKPSNIFMAREGGDEIVKLLDFGIARETRTQLVKDPGRAPRELVEERTGSGVVLGSPHHMSPEQAHGEKVDHRSDLWSLGVVLFRALTGRRPFEGEAMTVVMLAVVSRPIPRATEVCPDLPADLDRFFARALSRDLGQRFDSAMDMAAALTAISKGESPDPWLRGRSGEPTLLGRGPDEVTLDAVAGITPGSLPRAPAASSADKQAPDATGSREFSAVTTGLGSSPSKRSGALRWAPLLAVILAIGGLGFYLGKVGTEPTTASEASKTSEAPAAPAPSTGLTAIVTPATSATQRSEASASSAPAPTVSPATAAPEARPRPAPRPTTTATAEAPPAPRPKKIDPFTGLPIP